jgi:D-glycero-alpha-D-manno-heptose-7-phosphate kinase
LIITRTPLRISLGGGGTDLPSYYRENGGGFLVAAAISKYIYVSVHDNFEPEFLLKYSKIEKALTIQDIEHPMIREALKLFTPSRFLEISSQADIPAGTGLGSSGTFSVGLLHALSADSHQSMSQEALAELACRLEIEVLKEPVGKQDQYIASLGGLRGIEFRPDGTVASESIALDQASRVDLEERLLLFYTGVRRSAGEELAALDSGVSVKDKGMTSNLDAVKALGRESLRALELGDWDRLGRLFTQQWRAKYERSPSAIHKQIDQWIESGISSGALGGKLVGAGGGGFLLFLAENKSELRTRMIELGLREVYFSFDYEGTAIIR